MCQVTPCPGVISSAISVGIPVPRFKTSLGPEFLGVQRAVSEKRPARASWIFRSPGAAAQIRQGRVRGHQRVNAQTGHMHVFRGDLPDLDDLRNLVHQPGRLDRADHRHLFYASTRSIMAASPCPTPTHRAARP